jgi:hypothetical protein
MFHAVPPRESGSIPSTASHPRKFAVSHFARGGIGQSEEAEANRCLRCADVRSSDGGCAAPLRSALRLRPFVLLRPPDRLAESCGTSGKFLIQFAAQFAVARAGPVPPPETNPSFADHDKHYLKVKVYLVGIRILPNCRFGLRLNLTSKYSAKLFFVSSKESSYSKNGVSSSILNVKHTHLLLPLS